jgi:hypothetical protein
METLAASAVRQVRTTWSPAEMTLGVAVICATGAGAAAAVAAGAVDAVDGGGAGFLEHPAIAIRATARTTELKARNCRFNGVLLGVNSETGFQKARRLFDCCHPDAAAISDEEHICGCELKQSRCTNLSRG